ncbi:MAG: DUF3574 domain-containing protein [Cyanobacteria bacterium RU_5_0]|nr:DUF3574 domain-containing protein [Cyanobacteria bacterium RU_5_0]
MFLEAKVPALIQQDLYFGQELPGCKEISQEEFQAFVDEVITPRFPDGLTIFDADGQEKNAKVVSLFVEDTLESKVAIKEIVKAYKRLFRGSEVSRVTNKDDLKVSFGTGEDLIDNDTTPELIQVDLFFGRNIAGVGEVTEDQFQEFVDDVITSRFPAGLTVFDTNGQFQDSTGTIVEEPSKVVSLILEDTQANEAAINEIVEEYIQQFQQESVLQAVNEDITVSFSPTDDLIDNDLIPELVQVDLFFGRNIAGVGEVTEDQFQEFVDDVIAPRFSNRVAVYDADGQFQDSAGTIVEEKSKVVSLVFKDTLRNETYINDIVEKYIQQFQQESILIVVDEEIQASSLSFLFCGVQGFHSCVGATPPPPHYPSNLA